MKKHLKHGQINYSKKDIAIVVPYHKANLDEDEKFSIQQLKNLKGYSFFLVIPYKLKNESFHEFKGFKRILVKDKFLDTYKGYNQFLKTKEFYNYFKNFKYILIYQTDCLVFKDNLLEICNKNYDYIGAPIIQYGTKRKIIKEFVGNGGFSLRKVESAIKVLENKEIFSKRLKWIIFQFLSLPLKVMKYLLTQKPRSIYHPFTVNEDIFWSCEAKKFYPDFKIAPVEEAYKFSIEREIKRYIEKNNGKLPFGCHAYQKYNKPFWVSKLK